MELSAYLDGVRDNARQFVEAVRRAGVDAPVPTCPEWTVADLARHQGRVFYWISNILETKAQEYVDRRPFEEDAERADPLAFLEAGAEHAVCRPRSGRPRHASLELVRRRPWPGPVLVPADGPRDGRAPGRRGVGGRRPDRHQPCRAGRAGGGRDRRVPRIPRRPGPGRPSGTALGQLPLPHHRRSRGVGRRVRRARAWRSDGSTPRPTWPSGARPPTSSSSSTTAEVRKASRCSATRRRWPPGRSRSASDGFLRRGPPGTARRRRGGAVRRQPLRAAPPPCPRLRQLSRRTGRRCRGRRSAGRSPTWPSASSLPSGAWPPCWPADARCWRST